MLDPTITKVALCGFLQWGISNLTEMQGSYAGHLLGKIVYFNGTFEEIILPDCIQSVHQGWLLLTQEFSTHLRTIENYYK